MKETNKFDVGKLEKKWTDSEESLIRIIKTLTNEIIRLRKQKINWELPYDERN